MAATLVAAAAEGRETEGELQRARGPRARHDGDDMRVRPEVYENPLMRSRMFLSIYTAPSGRESSITNPLLSLL